MAVKTETERKRDIQTDTERETERERNSMLNFNLLLVIKLGTQRMTKSQTKLGRIAVVKLRSHQHFMCYHAALRLCEKRVLIFNDEPDKASIVSCCHCNYYTVSRKKVSPPKTLQQRV